MKLWLDDIRPCPDGYTHARSVNQAIRLPEQHDCTYASLDHDLGDFAEDGGNGYRLVLWMAEHDRWPSDGIRVPQCLPAGAVVAEHALDQPGQCGDGQDADGRQ